MQVAGTEQGVTEPEATFSACFGGAFLMWHPMKYASMLAEKMETHGTRAWLVNTGWTGGRWAVELPTLYSTRPSKIDWPVLKCLPGRIGSNHLIGSP